MRGSVEIFTNGFYFEGHLTQQGIRDDQFFVSFQIDQQADGGGWFAFFRFPCHDLPGAGGIGV